MTLGDWLAERSSHTAYGVDILKELQKFGIKAMLDSNRPLVQLSKQGIKRRAFIQGQRGADFAKAAANPKNPTGPMYADEGAAEEPILFGGWQLSSAIRKLLTGTMSTSMGRGTAFWDDVDAIRKWEAKQRRKVTV